MADETDTMPERIWAYRHNAQWRYPGWSPVRVEYGGATGYVREDVHEAEIENAKSQARIEVLSAPDGWQDLMAQTLQRLEVAAAINGTAGWNATGAKALAVLLRRLAEIADAAVEIQARTSVQERLNTVTSLMNAPSYIKPQDIARAMAFGEAPMNCPSCGKRDDLRGTCADIWHDPAAAIRAQHDPEAPGSAAKLRDLEAERLEIERRIAEQPASTREYLTGKFRLGGEG